MALVIETQSFTGGSSLDIANTGKPGVQGADVFEWTNDLSRDVYVSWAGWSHVGKASSANEAMNKAEAWLYNK